MDDDDLVLNLAPLDATQDRPNSRYVAQATKRGRWTDRFVRFIPQTARPHHYHCRVKAKRVAKRKDDRIAQQSPMTPNEENGADDHAEARPTKRQKLEANPGSTKPSTVTKPHPATSQIISSLFTSNPVIPTPAPLVPIARAGPSNAPLNASSFATLGLDPLLVAHLKNKLSISAPTSIQRATLSSLFAESDDLRDVFIQSQTGSGKTLAYLLPIVQDLLPLSRLSYIDRSIGTLAIIIAPTRELAKQISDVLELLLTLRLRPEGVNADGEPETEDAPTSSERLTRWLVSGVLTGGATRTHEKARLRKGLPILVATPGRLLDHLQKTESFNVGKCRWLVLDEADRLMELGFEETISGILKGLDGRRRLAKQAASEGIVGYDINAWDWERRRRTVLCSATIQEGVQRLAGQTLQHPIVIKGSDVSANDEDAVPDPHALKKSGKDQDVAAPSSSAPAKFTPPAQLAQKYMIVPLKLRLVSLVALLRGIVAQAPTNRPGRVGGTRIIVFLSCTDSVDYHWNLLGGVHMGGSTKMSEMSLENRHGSESGQSDSEPDAGNFSGRGKKLDADMFGKPKRGEDVTAIVHQSPLLPHTNIFRLHGSLPLANRVASLKGFTSDNSKLKAKHGHSPDKLSTGASSEAHSAVLLCTSVASRGLDLPLVRAVIQYDMPTENGAAEYVHRVGRTARAGKGGEAWSFVAPSESSWVEWIEGNMGNTTPHISGPNGPKDEDAKGSVKLEPVSVQDVLKRGFGGAGSEFEDRATQVQISFEQWVLKSKAVRIISADT